MSFLSVIPLAFCASIAMALPPVVAPFELSNPPVSCVEEAVPSLPSDGIVTEKFGYHDEITELLERTSGQLNETDSTFEDDWLLLNGAKDAQSKISSIYEAAKLNHMPPQILTGALLQESSMADLGISEDFGNWSCGIGQLNLLEWCQWANHASAEIKKQIHWPTKELDNYLKLNPGGDFCSGSFLRAAHIKPFYEKGLHRLRKNSPSEPAFLLSLKWLAEPDFISYEDAKPIINQVSELAPRCKRRNRFNDECLAIKPSRSEEQATFIRFILAKNFAEYCSDHRYGIPAKAYILRMIFESLPESIQNSQRYSESQSYPRSCLQESQSSAYPLQIGWLLADTVYNAGEEILPGVYTYWKKMNLEPDQVGPKELASAVDFSLSQRRFKKHMTPIGRCEAKFHIRNVIRNITLPGRIILPKNEETQDNECKLQSSSN